MALSRSPRGRETTGTPSTAAISRAVRVDSGSLRSGRGNERSAAGLAVIRPHLRSHEKSCWTGTRGDVPGSGVNR